MPTPPKKEVWDMTDQERIDFFGAPPGSGGITQIDDTTPTDLTGLIKGDGALISEATIDIDYASPAYVAAQIAALVDSAPATLNTLLELAGALGSDPNFATTIATALADKSAVGHVHAAGDVTSGQFAMARLASGTPNGTKFIRDDGVLVTPTAAASISQTEIDFGTTPLSEKLFTIPDASVSLSSKITGSVAYEAPTGKELDELEMDDLQLRFGPGTNEFFLYVRSANGSYLADKFKINYQVGA